MRAARAATGTSIRAGGIGGALTIDVTSRTDRLESLIPLPDGKMLLAGRCGSDVTLTFCAARVLPDGQLDAGFGPAGTGKLDFSLFAGFPTNQNRLAATARAPDGSLFFVGQIDSPTRGIIAKTTADGILDTSAADGNGWRLFDFDPLPAAPRTIVGAAAAEAGGAVIVAGEAKRPDGSTDMAVMRFRADLSGPDTAFGQNGAALVDFGVPPPDSDDGANAVAIQPDGKIVVAGIAGDGELAAARLESDGRLDAGFAASGKFRLAASPPGIVTAVRIDRSGRIVLAGYMLTPPDNADFVVDRLLPDGTEDPAFGAHPGPAYAAFDAGGRTTDLAFDLAVQSDGKILLAGWVEADSLHSYFGVARFTHFGTLDTGFGLGGLSIGNYGAGGYDTGIKLFVGNGGIMVAGSSRLPLPSEDYVFGISRLRLDRIFVDGFQ